MNEIQVRKPREQASPLLVCLPSGAKPEARRLPAVEQLYRELVVRPRRHPSESQARVRYYQD